MALSKICFYGSVVAVVIFVFAQFDVPFDCSTFEGCLVPPHPCSVRFRTS